MMVIETECEQLRRLAADLKLGLSDVADLVESMLNDTNLSAAAVQNGKRAASAARRMAQLADVTLAGAPSAAEQGNG